MIPLLTLLYANVRRHHVAALLALALVAILAGGEAFSLAEGVSFGTGIY
jgi:hypothetical protein